MALQPKQGGRYVDGTLGAGGHARGILEASSPTGLLLGLDVDPLALQSAAENLAPFTGRTVLVQASYITLNQQLVELGWDWVDGILLDLGLSSMQLDTPERGFSFQTDAPLDMRFDPTSPISAVDLVNQLPEAELADLIYRFGEEPGARKVARAVVKNRPVETTHQLAEIILAALGRTGSHLVNRSSRKPGQQHKKNIHPATRTFQALRIAVNQELVAIETVLPQAVTSLAPGGRLAVISFHSLEDRIVKQYFRRESQDCICPPRQPVCTCGHQAVLEEVTRKPIQPQPVEIIQNPRSRSARLRVAQKIPLRSL